ncbi:ion transporter [Adhaeretor mobilis]|uniref:Cyclic nucleotide-gated potassium channel n=1 Tax=Adhaeretor mobilis TaxID=1930276 RepID=A0A517N346_9BACT|nr:ion transporter [Adhaeretor mobilis]QDT01554.1 Cyclic nucleotide-gated potassium channel [Adhaeretor mobilis]
MADNDPIIDPKTKPTPPPIESPAALSGWQRRWHEIIFEADTPAGKAFDITLLVLIVISVVGVLIQSTPTYEELYQPKWGRTLDLLEWVITILFTVEYIARLACVAHPLRYVFSFYGIVDLLAILPSYLAPFVSGTQALATIRTLRLLRVFRVFKLGDHLAESRTLLKIVKQTRTKITVFLSVIMIAITVLGTIMYVIERDEPGSGFTSIPISIYWAIVTLTTVGYGDIAPVTVLGKTVAGMMMLIGYSITVVTIGIFAAVVLGAKEEKQVPSTQSCPNCLSEDHAADAKYCKRCGSLL